MASVQLNVQIEFVIKDNELYISGEIFEVSNTGLWRPSQINA